MPGLLSPAADWALMMLVVAVTSGGRGRLATKHAPATSSGSAFHALDGLGHGAHRDAWRRAQSRQRLARFVPPGRASGEERQQRGNARRDRSHGMGSNVE